MPNVLIESSTMEEIGNAIRKKTGTVDKIYPNDMPEAIGRIESGEFLTKEEADARYLQLTGGSMTPDAKIKFASDDKRFANIDKDSIEIGYEQPDGLFPDTIISPGAISWGNISGSGNASWNELYENQANLGGIYLSWDNEGNLIIGALKISGIPTVIDAEFEDEYEAQKNDAASVGYVRDSIKAAIGDINTLLDQINGEVV